MDVLQDASQHGRSHTTSQQVQRLHERHTRLEQGCELLIEHQKFRRPDLPGAWRSKEERSDETGGPEGQDAEPTLLKVVAQARFTLRRVHAFDHLSVR
jgi:hypothetical protein